MTKWHIIGRHLKQTELVEELVDWLGQIRQAVYLFREGPTISRFDWGNAEWLTGESLSQLWLTRLFCREFELYARRTGHDGYLTWQLRIAAAESLLTTGEVLIPLGAEETSRLLGQATGNGEEFELKPNRYQRARLRYPGSWGPQDACGLVAQRFRPRSGGGVLVCWKALTTLPGSV